MIPDNINTLNEIVETKYGTSIFIIKNHALFDQGKTEAGTATGS